MGEQCLGTNTRQDWSRGFPPWREGRAQAWREEAASFPPQHPYGPWGPQGDSPTFYNFRSVVQKLPSDVFPLCYWGVPGAESVMENSQREDQIDGFERAEHVG